MNEAFNNGHAALVKLLHHYQENKLDAPSSDVAFLLNHNPLLEKIFIGADCAIAIADASNGNYLYKSQKLERLLGFQSSAFQQTSLDFTVPNTHPDDVPGIMEVMEMEKNYLAALTPAERLNHCSSYDYRIRKTDGTLIRVLQRNLILNLGPADNMLYVLLIFTDISYLKKDNSKILYLINQKEGGLTYIYNLADRRMNKDTFLSKREIEILKLLGKGYSSKEVADELFISVHTVETHRRNMLEKTNIKDTSCLVHFSILAGF